MNTMKNKLTLLFTVFVLFALSVSCSSDKSPLTVFQPEAGSPFKITFSYPDNWNWESPPDSMTRTFGAMYVFDPYPASNPGLRKMGRLIYISVVVNAHPKTSAQEDIERFLISVTIRESNLLDDKSLQINGHDVRWFTLKNRPNIHEGENQPTISERIFLLAEDRYYDILLNIPEDELNGQFHTEFKAMVETIKFLP